MTLKTDIKIEYVSPESLIPYEKNARTHTPDQVDQICESIKQFGFTNPILISEKKEVIAGHGRLDAAKILKLERVPAIVLSGLSEEQRRAYVIADNKIALNSGWDEDLLLEEILFLQEKDFDLSLIGFSDEELNALLPDEEVEEKRKTEEDEVPEPPEAPVTASGDVWILGEHRVMCGDSTSIESVEKLMNGQKADMLFTDPPYLMDFTGGIHSDGSKSFNAKHGGIKNDKMSDQDGNNFLDAINSIIQQTVRGAFYITFYRLGIDRYFASMARTGLQCRSLIIWDKGNHTLSNSDYMSMYEPMFYGWVNEHNFYGGNNGMDIWRIARTSKNDLHPTVKPVELVEKAVSDGSMAGDTVLDLFGGSGTTIIACEKTKRQARLMELDPKYCDVIIKRWQEYTGLKAIHADSGKTFEELLAE